MSTRAIIAVPTAKGYKTAWCWNDGFPNVLGRKLRCGFKTKALAEELVNQHSFRSIMSLREHKKYWEKESGFTTKQLSNGYVLHLYPYSGRTVAGRGRYGFFKTIEEMLGQDLDYVYVFEDDKWKTYK